MSAERKAREHAVAVLHRLSQGTDCDGWLSAPPVPAHFLEVMSLWKSATSALTSRMKNCDLIRPTHAHKLSNGAKADNVNVGLLIAK